MFWSLWFVAENASLAIEEGLLFHRNERRRFSFLPYAVPPLSGCVDLLDTVDRRLLELALLRNNVVHLVLGLVAAMLADVLECLACRVGSARESVGDRVLLARHVGDGEVKLAE